ncbi:MAG: hypothetical protein ACT4O1_13925 [Gemmatimonadota bacterium]
MASVSALDASTAQVLRAKLEALDGIERIVVDETTSTVMLHCSPDANSTALNKQIEAAITASGVEQDSLNIRLLTDLAARRRVKFAGVDRIVEHTHVRIRITLEWSGETTIGEAVGESGELIELRTAAAAALKALERVLGEDLHIKLVGVKQVKAFDAELMVVALYRTGDAPQRLVGSVSATGDPRRAAAVAVLNALNRVLGNYLSVRE